MKVRSSVKATKRGDKIVRRKGRVYLLNKSHPRRKMRQG